MNILKLRSTSVCVDHHFINLGLASRYLESSKAQDGFRGDLVSAVDQDGTALLRWLV